MTVEVLVEGCERRREILLAVDASSEAAWVKNLLNRVFFLDQPFAVGFDTQNEADGFAERIRLLGFRCRVSETPPPGRV